MKRVYIGTSGYQYDDWIGKFYPKELPKEKWLEYYSKRFNTVEINATFYRGFGKNVFQSWEERTSKNFTFCIKGARFVTHIKQLKDVSEPLDYFFKSASGLKQKLKLVLWQFPKSFTLGGRMGEDRKERFKQFVTLLPKKIPQAMEFRNKTWFNEEIYSILRKRNIAWVIADSSEYPKEEVVTADFMYFRFHGPGPLFSSKYNLRTLKKWANTIQKYRRSRDIYCYFNNDFKGYAVDNARTLRELLK